MNTSTPGYQEYPRAVVLERLMENREKHVKEVKKFKKQRVKTLAKEFYRQAEKAKAGHQTDFGWVRKFPTIIDYTDQYDQAIDRFSSQESDLIEMTPFEFNKYMRNEWEWSNQFASSTSHYMVR